MLSLQKETKLWPIFSSKEPIQKFCLGPLYFQRWSTPLKFHVCSTTRNYHQVTVPTAETASATFWMEQRMAMGKAVMLVGPAGTGKTQLVMGALRSLMEKPGVDYMTSKVNMNFYTR